MRLECRQDFLGEATNLLDEHLLRHRPAIETDLYHIGTGTIGGSDDPLRDFLRCAPRQMFSLPRDIFKG